MADMFNLLGLAAVGLEVITEFFHCCVILAFTTKQETLFLEIVHHGDVVVAFAQAGLINADDFYGADAYEKLAGFLRTAKDSEEKASFCMVGFQLKNTLSDFGSVARGVCKSDENGKLVSVTEMTKIVRTPTGAENLEDESEPVKLSGNELVSMNMWGFTPSFNQWVEKQFVEFLKTQGSEMKSECYVPLVVDNLIKTGVAEVDVLETKSTWFGVTYQEDKPHVIASIQQLIAAGRYPENLWE